MHLCFVICNLLILTLLLLEINSEQKHLHANSQAEKYKILRKWTNIMASLRNSNTMRARIDSDRPIVLKKSYPNNGNQLIDDGKNVHSLIPNNPAPMLKPNPFVNSNGKQIEFAQDVTKNHKKKIKEPERQKEGSFCRRSFDGRSGYCILAYQCLHIIREYRMHGTKIDICTYRNTLPVICCPLAEKHLDNLRISAQKCMEYNEAIRSVRLETPQSFSGRVCIASIPMIVGGEETRTGEYPHMAALGWSDLDSIRWGCGGVLISEKFVLTAAHCTTFGDKPPDIVRLGTHNLNNAYRGHQDIKILLIILHPKYQTSQYYNDVAVLKLSKSAKLSATVRPACLWHLPDLNVQTITAIGWGRTEFLGDGTDLLQKVHLNLISQKKCRKIYKKERRLPHGIMDEQFCAGILEGGKDTCQGDSGGPVIVELPEYNCVQFVVGITSFGKFCALANAPGVYTKISTYLDWIESVVFQT